MNLKGKKVAFVGDSISEGVGVSAWENCYHQLVKKKAELAWAHVNAISGSRIAHQINPSECPRGDLLMSGRAYDLPKDADIVVVFGGINDYCHGDAPIGAMGDTTCGTFWGAVDHMMKYLKSTYPTVVFMTPGRCFCDGHSGEEPSCHEYKRGNAVPLPEYVQAIVACGEKHGVPVLNLYERLPIDPADPAQMAAYISGGGVHYNDRGHAMIADLLLAFLQDIDD